MWYIYLFNLCILVSRAPQTFYDDLRNLISKIHRARVVTDIYIFHLPRSRVYATIDGSAYVPASSFTDGILVLWSVSDYTPCDILARNLFSNMKSPPQGTFSTNLNTGIKCQHLDSKVFP
jgi:hypothetical protein